MKKNFIFKGIDRVGQQPKTYGNIPLLVAALYDVQDSEDSKTESFIRTKNKLSFTPFKLELDKKELADFLADKTVNYLFGDIKYEGLMTHAYQGNWGDLSTLPATLPQYLHYFDLDIPDEKDTLYVNVQANYNFYLDRLEKLDADLNYEIQPDIRPNDFYAYKSVKIINDRMKEKNKGITADQFCYRTDILSKTYVEQVGKKEYKFNIAQPEQNNSFLKNYLNQTEYPLPNLGEQKEKFLSDLTFQPTEFWTPNKTTFISQDKQLLDAVINAEKTLPYSVTIEANLNKVFNNAGNSEFKRILKDLNLYETFIYNLVDRNEKPFFSISDDGIADFTKINKDFTLGPKGTEVLRAPAVAMTLAAALKTQGLISPISNVLVQSDRLKKQLRPEALKIYTAQRKTKAQDEQQEFLAQSLNLSTGYKVTPKGTPNEEILAARTDFIYTEHNENTTVTDFDAFIFASRMEEFVNNNYLSITDRTISDSTNNTVKPKLSKNYAEVICYSVERHRVVTNQNGDEELVFTKEFIVPASLDKDELIKVVDAGINYDQKYVYRVFAHVLSLGSGVKSTFTKVGKSDDGEGDIWFSEKTGNLSVDKLILNFITYPDLRIMRVPVYQSQEVYVLDSPPVYPSSLVIPSRQDPTKVKLVLSDNVSGVKDYIIPLFPEDDNELAKLVISTIGSSHPMIAADFLLEWTAAQIKALRTSMSDYPDVQIAIEELKQSITKILSDAKGKTKSFAFSLLLDYYLKILDSFEYTFNTRSPVVSYEILRLEEAPISYLSFFKAKRIKIDKAINVGFDDSIIPNKDYYYCFRSINSHGYFSNPSPVVHVRVDQEEELHIAEVKPYAFPAELNPTPVYEPMLSDGIISVSLAETAVIASTQEDKYPALAEVEYSSDDETKQEGHNTSGNRFFKIRATSRATGRSIDLNFFPKIKKISGIPESDLSISEAKSKGFSGGDLTEVSNYFDMSTKALSQLFIGEEEFSVDNELIEKLADRVRNNKLDLQTLQSLMANYKKIR